MATLQLVDIGAVADDGTGNPLRTAFDRINNSLNAINNEVAALTFLSTSDFIRVGLNVACNGTSGQTIAYTSAFTGTAVVYVFDKNGVGVELVVGSQDVNGFDINSLVVSTFDYIAIITE